MNKQCGAKTRAGGRCRKAPLAGRTRCRFHGGKSRPAGPTHHNWKHGKRSKVLGARYDRALKDLPTLQDLYHLARTDPKLLQLTEDIALLVAKQQQTVEGLRTGESGAAWQALAPLVDRALAQRTLEETRAVLDTLAAVVANGVGDAAVWEEYAERAESIRRLVDTQRKYEEGLRLYLPLEQAQAIFVLWQDAIRSAVPQEYIARIYEELQKSRAGRAATNLH
jgi:hypothetical protein